MESQFTLLKETTATLADHQPTLITHSQKRSTLIRRGLSSFGGYALRSETCPSGSSTCGDGYCCPSSYTCDVYYQYDPPICCPSSADCKPTVRALKACADNSWGLYVYDDIMMALPDYFCCLGDAIGAKPSTDPYICISKSLPFPSSITLSEIKQATGTRTVGRSASQATSSESGLVSRTQTASRSEITGPSSSSGATRGSSQTGLPLGAVIAIAVLTTVVVMLLIFIGWLFYSKRSRQLRQGGLPPINSPVTERSEGILEPPLPPANGVPYPRTRELSGGNVTGSVYGSDAARRVELDTSKRTES